MGNEIFHRMSRSKGFIRTQAFLRPDAIKAIQVPSEHKDARRKHRQRHADLHQGETGFEHGTPCL